MLRVRSSKNRLILHRVHHRSPGVLAILSFPRSGCVQPLVKNVETFSISGFQLCEAVCVMSRFRGQVENSML